MDAGELVAWRKRCGFRRDAEAAAALGVSVPTFRRMRKGKTPIKRPTVLLAHYYEVFSVDWLAKAEAVNRLAHFLHVPLAPAAAEAVAQVLAKVISPRTSRR